MTNANVNQKLHQNIIRVEVRMMNSGLRCCI